MCIESLIIAILQKKIHLKFCGNEKNAYLCTRKTERHGKN